MLLSVLKRIIYVVLDKGKSHPPQTECSSDFIPALEILIFII